MRRNYVPKDEDDAYVRISRENLPKVIARLQANQRGGISPDGHEALAPRRQEGPQPCRATFCPVA
jgi:hypothetical protein